MAGLAGAFYAKLHKIVVARVLAAVVVLRHILCAKNHAMEEQALKVVAVGLVAKELGRGRRVAQAYLLLQPLGALGKLRSQL